MNTHSSTTLPWCLRYLIASVAVIHAVGFGMVLATATDWGRAYGLGIGVTTVFFTSTVFTLFAVVHWLRMRAKPTDDAAASAP